MEVINLIKAIHLDDRLIHGQVALAWTRFLAADLLLVVNDKIVDDTLRRNALRLGVPDGVKFGFRTVETGIEFLTNPENDKYNVMVLIDNAQDAETLCLTLPGIKKMTIGGVRRNAPMIVTNLSLTEEDKVSLKNIMDHGIEVGLLPTPRHKYINLNTLI